MIGKIYRKIIKTLKPEHSMANHPAEKYYFKQYWKYIEKYLPKKGRILEIGCHEGRFTIPLLNHGLEVHATDIKKKYEGIIRNASNSKNFHFKLEGIQDTAKRTNLESFEAIMCLELLYTMPDYEQLVGHFHKGMKKGSLFISSHRSMGYYIHRFVKEKKWEELKMIKDGNHEVFNAQYSGKLHHFYTQLGFEVKELLPIGSLSGFGNDPFSSFADPTVLSADELQELSLLENDPQIQTELLNSARYLLVIAEKA